MWVRLMFENSTVCLISRRISLLCPVGIRRVLGVAVSLTMILADGPDLCGWGCLSLVLFSRGMWLLLIVAPVCGLWLWVGVVFFDGEFDPGSGRTLAACLTHASRAERLLRGYSSGERVSNT